MALNRKPPYFATIITLVAVLTMCALGFWQIQRAQEKTVRLAQIEKRQSSAPLSLEALLSMPGDLRDVPFDAYGELNTEKYFLLDNRLESGKVGYHILAPMTTDQGVLLVNFGWVKATERRDVLPEVNLPILHLQVNGTSQIPFNNPMVTETAKIGDPWPLVIQAIDLDSLSKFSGKSLLPIVMQLDAEHPAGFIRNWKAVVMAPEKHYAYALQWFGLAVACILIYIVALRKRKV